MNGPFIFQHIQGCNLSDLLLPVDYHISPLSHLEIVKFENLAIESREILLSTSRRRRIYFSYHKNIKIILKLLISIIKNCQKEIEGKSHAEI
jgi:hypothetical protein